MPEDLIAGRWWEPGHRRSARHGVLDLRDGAELRLTGVFRGNDDPYCAYAVVVGESASGENFTLLNANSAGVSSSIRGRRTSLSELIHPGAVLKGAVDRTVQLAWSDIDVGFDRMDEWALTAYGELGKIDAYGAVDGGGHWVTYRFEFPRSIDAKLEFGTVTLWCGSQTGGDGGFHTFQMTREPRVHVCLGEPSSLSDIETRILKPLQYFFTFAVDGLVTVRSLTLRCGDGARRRRLSSHQEVLFRRTPRHTTERPGPAYFEMLLPLSAIEAKFQTVMERWNELWVNYEPVLDLLLTPTGGPSSLEAYFLESVQAAELFHRRYRPDAVEEDRSKHAARIERITSPQAKVDAAWLRQRLQWSNEPRLQARIADLVEASNLALRLSGDPDFPRRVARTRNFLIHRSPHLKRRAAGGGELWWLGLQVRAIVRAIFLLELGFEPEEAWERLRDTRPVRQLMHREHG